MSVCEKDTTTFAPVQAVSLPLKRLEQKETENTLRKCDLCDEKFQEMVTHLRRDHGVSTTKSIFNHPLSWPITLASEFKAGDLRRWNILVGLEKENCRTFWILVVVRQAVQDSGSLAECQISLQSLNATSHGKALYAILKYETPDPSILPIAFRIPEYPFPGHHLTVNRDAQLSLCEGVLEIILHVLSPVPLSS